MEKEFSGEMSFDEWQKEFRPILDDYGNIKKFPWLDEKTVEDYGGYNHFWTVHHSDGSGFDGEEYGKEFRDFIFTGIHRVNCLHYIVTEKEWNEEILVFVDEEDDNE